MTRLMYDTTNMSTLPENAPIVAGYPHAWQVDYEKFPHSLWVRIDNHGDHADDCHVLDVEQGAATAATALQWVQSWHKLHPSGMDTNGGHFSKPTLYFSSSRMHEVGALLSGQVYDVWVAQWDRNTTPIPGTVGKQYASDEMLSTDYDASVIYDDTWGVHPTNPQPVAHPRIVALVIPLTSNDPGELIKGMYGITSADGKPPWY